MLSTVSWNTSDAASSELRDALVKFWLSAPTDQVSTLWLGPVGDATKRLVSRLSEEYKFAPHQVRQRDELGSWFNEHTLQHPLALQYMIANFLYSPPGLLAINNIDSFFPEWFVSAYTELYQLKTTPAIPKSPLPPQTTPAGSAYSAIDFGPFPSSLAALSANRVHLNRLLGLANLYYIDPEDKEIAQETLDARHRLATLILAEDESKLEKLWETDLSDRYWALVRSGIQNENLTSDDSRIKDMVTKHLTPSLGGPGLGSPGSMNAFLVSMLYYLPGSMKVESPHTKLPAWLLQGYETVFHSSQ